MPKPTSSTATARPDLGLIALEHTMQAAARGFIGLQVLPVLPVAQQTGIYPKITKESFLKLRDTARKSGAAYNRDDYEFEDDNYATKEHGVEEPLDDREVKVYEGIYQGLDLEALAVFRAENAVLMGQEKRVADMVFNATTFASYTSAVSTEWSTGSSCTPISDVKVVKELIRLACGLAPNAIIFNKTVFNNLTMCSQINDKIKYAGTPFEALAEEEQVRALAKAFGLQVLVAGGLYDSAKKGQDAAISNIWSSEYAMVARLAMGPVLDLKEPCLGRTFLWNENSAQNPIVETYREETIRSDIYRVRHDVQEKLMLAPCGYLLSNITA